MIFKKQIILLVLLSIYLHSCINIKYLFIKPTNLEFTRSSTAISGSTFLKQTSFLSKDKREKRIEEELISGNMPSFLKSFVPIDFKSGSHKVRIWVAPDYLSIGPNWDFVRIPMTPSVAQHVARYYGMALPTVKIVDKIYSLSSKKLSPSFLPPSPSMGSNDYYKRHNAIINASLKYKYGSFLLAGHKKDIVITNRLKDKKPERVAIYGWHRPNYKAVQPLSTVHDSKYADYSHGVRLISRKVMIDNKEYSYSEVLSDKKLAPILSYEGTINDVNPY